MAKSMITKTQKTQIVAKPQTATAISSLLGKMPKFSHRQSIEAVMLAIQVENSNATKEAKQEAANIAVGIVKNSDSLELADMASQNLSLLKLLGGNNGLAKR
jgi:hypothetical protein